MFEVTGVSNQCIGVWMFIINDDKDKKYEINAAENFVKTKRFLFNLVKSKSPIGKKRSLRS